MIANFIALTLVLVLVLALPLALALALEMMMIYGNNFVAVYALALIGFVLGLLLYRLIVV